MAVVFDKDELTLDDVFYKIVGPVRSMLASQYPPKYVIGDTDKDSGRGTSVVAWSDFRGGMGRYQMEDVSDVHRTWFSFAQVRRGHCVLPPLRTTTSNPGTGDPGVIGELADEIYASFASTFHKYNNGTDTWGSSLRTLAAAATDILTARMLDDTVYLIIAQTSDYDYTSDGSSYTRSTKDVKYLAFWDDRLWGIDNTGQLWWSLTLGTETDDAKLPLPDGAVTDLFVAYDAAGALILYAATRYGLWAHDAANSRFVETALTFPRNATAGEGCAFWRGSIYFPAGNAIYKYDPRAGGAISRMGPDQDDGMPVLYTGDITGLLGTHNELLARIKAITDSSHNIMAWDGVGWHQKAVETASNQYLAMYAGSAYSTYRLYLGSSDDKIVYLPLETDIANPNVITTMDYHSAGELWTPWFTANQEDVDKLFVRLRVEVQGASANETVKVEYGTDYSTSWTNLGTITADGITTYSPAVAGMAFRAIRFQCTLARGGTTTNTPDLLSLTLEYRKKLPARWGFSFDVILQDHKKVPAKTLRANLLTAIEQNAMVKLMFHDDDAINTYYVDVISAEGLENSGESVTGRTTVTVAEL